MSIETDAERLAMLEGMPGLGSVTARVSIGSFSGLFDREYVALPSGQVEFASEAPALVCLESDANRLVFARGTVVSIEDEGDFVVRHRADRPQDLGPGYTRLLLGKG